MTTTNAWVGPTWGRADTGQLGPSLRDCLTAAIAAPSIHNTQPWLFRPFRGGIDVFADQSRRLDVIDPRGRELFISVGAALLNLRLAILARGRTPLQQLLPDPGEPDLVARILIGPPCEPTDTVRLLAQAIPRRHTIRKPFTDDSVPLDVMHDLVAAADAEGGRLVVPDEATGEAVLSLVRTAEAQARRNPEYWRELAEWTHSSRHRHDGVPPEAFGPWSALEAVPIRDFGLLEPVRHRMVASYEEQPTIAILYTVGDQPVAWLRAGEALQRTLLTACVRGVSTTLMTQPLEVPWMRAQLDDTAMGSAAQAIIRLGYGPPGAPTPRRPLEHVIR